MTRVMTLKNYERMRHSEVCQKGKVQIKCKRLGEKVGVCRNRCQFLREFAKRRKAETQPTFNKNPGPTAQHERFILPHTVHYHSNVLGQ